jgi:AcrR family transcriptional regulator
MSPTRASTPDKLLDAAARLFAERGIENVAVAEIVRAAGQRNASAVNYHFGTRDDLLHAVLARHVPVLAGRRRELLDVARTAGDVRSAAEAIVRPVTEFAQRGWRERAYLQIGSDVAAVLDRTTPAIRELLTETAGYEAWDLLRSRVALRPAAPGVRGPSGPSERGAKGPSGPSERGAKGPSGPSEREVKGPSGPSEREVKGPSGPSEREVKIPRRVWVERQAICTVFIGRAAADRARKLDQGGEHLVLSDDRFVSNLVDMAIGAMTAPVT